MSTRQYVGARYVPKFYDYNGSSVWRSNTEYEALTIVTVNGNSYTSKIPVPSSVGSPDQNPEYWVATGLYNQQVEAYRQLTLAVADRVEEVATEASQDVADEATTRENADTALGDRIDDEATARENADTDIGDRIDELIANSQRILIVGSNSQFTTINAAITEARTFCSPTNRALIMVLPGDYNENIVLHPNPGIDIIGYGARIVGQFAYPDCCLYTCGSGTFVGLYFENNYATAYAAHVERDLPTDTAGVIKFYDCDFVSMQYHGCGCGMTPSSELAFRGCRFYSAASVTDAAALYLHNADKTDATPQTIYVCNCYFESSTNDVRIDDACNINGHTHSPLYLFMYGNNGKCGKVRFYNTSYTYSEASKDTPGPNITMLGRGNSDLALNTNRIKTAEINVTADSGGYIRFPLAYDKNLCTVNVTLPNNPGIPILPMSQNGSGAAGAGLTGTVVVQIEYVPL